ncbi:MAG: iron-sulfur cluster assembly scaffold protein [Deltaproteobacteria bacterium]|nr:iron-sulfur cluster assembly scaffold protein [Deltaproteobacteria bacterium]
MNKTISDFWQDHSRHYLEMAFSVDRREVVTSPDAYGKKTGDCGDTIEFFLAVNGDTIESVSFMLDGCLNTNAAANTVAHLIEGKSVEQAWEITPEDIADYLETLPVENFHCAELAVGALYLALANYRELKQSPWKKSYSSKT